MRIAFLSTGWQSSHGGIQTVNRNLAIALSRLGHEISMIIPQIAANDAQEAAELKIGLEPAGQNFIRALRILEDFEPDIICGHSKFTGEVAQTLIPDFPKAIRVHFIHYDPETIEGLKEYRVGNVVKERDDRSYLETSIAMDADLILTVGKNLKELFEPRINALCTSREINIPLIEHLNVGMADLLEPPLPSTRYPEVLVLGRTDSVTQKGLDLFARAAAYAETALRNRSVGRQPLQPQFRVRGGQEDCDVLEQKLKEISMSDGYEPINLRVYPYTTDGDVITQDILRASLLILPSRAEGYGLTAFEALSHAIPVIVSSETGAANLLITELNDKPYLNKIIWNYKDNTEGIKELGQAIIDLLSDETGARRIAKEIKTRLLSIASWDIAAHNFIRLCERAQQARELRVGGVLSTTDTEEGEGQSVNSRNADRYMPRNITVLLSLTDDELSRRTCEEMGVENYSEGRKHADQGEWDDSFYYHFRAYVCFLQSGVNSWIARVLGRLGWCLIAAGYVDDSFTKLAQAAKYDPIQSAGNYLWAAQYCMRANALEDAKKMIEAFNSLVSTPRIAAGNNDKTLAGNDLSELLILRDFYTRLVGSNRALGVADSCASDQGRLYVLSAVLEPERANEYLSMASLCFHGVGLNSYAHLCEGRQCLLLASTTVEIDGRLANLNHAIDVLHKVHQRFAREGDVLSALVSTAETHHKILLAMTYLNSGREQDAIDNLIKEARVLISQHASRFSDTFLNLCQRVDSLLSESLRLPHRDTPESQSQINTLLDSAHHIFRNVYENIPALDAFYSPDFRTILRETLIPVE